LRYSLVRVNEHVDAVTLAGGQADEQRRLERDLSSVIGILRRLVTANIRLDWVTDTYGWVTIVAPIIIDAPVYFGGDMTFGGLMMAVGAFNQFHASLRWFVDNIGSIADWRATLRRVAAFRLALVEAGPDNAAADHIAFVASPGPAMVLDDLEMDAPCGPVRLSQRQVVIQPGERVLVTGPMGAGKTLLTHTIAGLWRRGKGIVHLPQDGGIAYLVRDPYMPPGTLRAALCYPRSLDACSTEAIVAALTRAGLARLSPWLDRSARWEHEFSNDERRMLSLARALLQRPGWIVIDDVDDLTEGENGARVAAIFHDDLASAAIIAMGAGEGHGDLFSRKLRLVSG
jgi:putative ATP-binding cassette transporter